MEPSGEVFDVPQWLRLPGYEWLVPFGKTQTPKEWQETLQHNAKMGRPFVTWPRCFADARSGRVHVARAAGHAPGSEHGRGVDFWQCTPASEPRREPRDAPEAAALGRGQGQEDALGGARL